LNGGSLMYYEDVGVKKTQWITARDEFVRESHRQLDGKVVPVGQRFANGCRYPADQDCHDAGEVCNCRCRSIAVIEGVE